MIDNLFGGKCIVNDMSFSETAPDLEAVGERRRDALYRQLVFWDFCGSNQSNG